LRQGICAQQKYNNVYELYVNFKSGFEEGNNYLVDNGKKIHVIPYITTVATTNGKKKRNVTDSCACRRHVQQL
jgi:hypothetical protein